nr:MATE family efflux transporter [Marinicella sp. W31]MDC2879888.1 MATE family efflux transporter [Marinicella sp. W31]
MFARTGKPLTEAWGRAIALGLPQSLSLIGISLSTGCILVSVRVWFSEDYDLTIAAYGIASRLLTFAFLPLMGLNFACQSIVGNNYGAALYQRSNRTLVVGLLTGLCYGLIVQAVFVLAATPIAALFVDDPQTIAAAAHIVRIVTAAYVVVAPVMVLSGYFQAIGKALGAGVMSLGRTYLFNIPLIFSLPFLFGRQGIWMAAPTSDVAMLVLVAAVLWHHRAKTGARWGMFHREAVIA